jgi:hypothetical protein
LKDLERANFEENVPLETESKPTEYQAVIDSLKSKFKEGNELQDSKGSEKIRITASANFLTPEQEKVIIQSVERAIAHMGRNGKEIFLGILHKRYGLVRQDMVDAPGRFMGVLRVYLGSTASVLERCALDEIEARLKVSATSLEEAVAILRGQASEAVIADASALPERRRTKKGDLILFEYHSPGHGNPDG